MKFPVFANAFGHRKVILEIRGNATGIVEQRACPRHHRRLHHVADARNIKHSSLNIKHSSRIGRLQ